MNARQLGNGSHGDKQLYFLKSHAREHGLEI